MYIQGTTAYLGDEYSYSYAAATELVGGSLKNYDAISKAIAAASSGECFSAVVPLENNVEGAVNEAYDALFDSGLYIARQLILPVKHSLIAAEGATLSGLTRIVSHAQAIAQCHNFLLPLSVSVEAAPSTSEALKRADLTTAAIAYRPREGQTVLAKNIQDSALNATRFALLTKTAESDGDKASVIFDLKDKPGTLFKALEEIYRRGVNMTRILSRPHRSGSGAYRFFVDFDFDGSSDELDDLLSAMKANCSAFRFLGRYRLYKAERND